METIATRFAPSPTGFLHIGGLRTALFAYLFARHSGGRFILRIEDTDRTRLVQGALQDIIDNLRWIGIDWDEGPDIGGGHAPYQQSERKEIYREHAMRLVRDDRAYRCFCSPERLAELRKNGNGTGYDGKCRNLTHEETEKRAKNGERFVIRLKTPLEGETSFDDMIRGKISTKNTIVDDTVLLKSDGFPTYHLANVVDDHLMEITHVIRGDEWISSTPRHIILYDAFGWKPPCFAHVPVILAQGGGKLSKRHGATMVREFRERGYLNTALLNFISLLGWSLDDKTTFFSMQELIENFDLSQVTPSSAVFSYEKLDWFNGMYIRKTTDDELYDLIIPHMTAAGLVRENTMPGYEDYIRSIVPLIRERLKTLSDAPGLTRFFFDDCFEIREEKALIPKKGNIDDALRILRETLDRLETADPFEEEEIEARLRKIVADLDMKAGTVFMVLRIAVTGSKVSPGLFETMRVLGKERVLSRLASALDTVARMEKNN